MVAGNGRPGGEDRRHIVRAVIDANRFMTLATADEHGTPWATPVWFASPDDQRFLWVSSPTTRHSRNIAARPDIAIVIYDSRTAIADRQAVYIEAIAGEVSDDGLDGAIEIFAKASASQGLAEWGREELTPPARFRLYQAMATALFVLADTTDVRLPVAMA